METLIDFVKQLKSISNQVNDIGGGMTNGVNTLSNRIESLKNIIETSDYTYTKFGPLFPKENISYGEVDIKNLQKTYSLFIKELPILQEKLNYDFSGTFQKILAQEDFVEKWNELDNEAKSTILYFDKEMYKNVRQKIDVSEFNFLFDQDQSFDGSYPEIVFKWIHAESKSKFFLLRKEAQGTAYEDFFNSDEVKAGETLSDSDLRDRIAVRYLTKLKQNDTTQCWYTRLDALSNKGAFFHYTYHFFSELEDEFNGYSNVTKNIKLPDILKKWTGKILDDELFQAQAKLFEVDSKDPNFNYMESLKKYSMLKLAQDLQNPLTKTDLANLKVEAKDTEFEEFFNHPMTAKMIHAMPYKREDYMFVYFRDKFTKESKNKIKP
jgi:hypothetical protein